jgi:hypothetical protein
MSRTSLGLAGLLLALQANAEDPAWLEEARALEGKPQPPREFTSEDGFFKAKVPAKVVGKIVKEQGSYTVEIDLGSEDAQLYCEVVPDGMDMAEMMRGTFQNILKHTNESETLKVLESELEGVDAGAWGKVPYLKATWNYVVHDGKERLLAGMRQYSFEKDGHGVYCGIIELGYANTLDNVVKSFAESVQFRDVELTPYYTEISVISVDDRVIGVAQLNLHKDAEGDILARLETSMMVPKPDGSATTREAVRSEWSTPDGGMINAGHVLATDGEVATQLSLKRGDGRWIVSGTYETKEIEKPLDEGISPTGLLKMMLDSRNLLAAESPTGGELSALVWSSEDPTKLTGANLKIKDGAGSGLYRSEYKSGNTVTDGVLDQRGSTVSAEVKTGAVVFKARRVSAIGTF